MPTCGRASRSTSCEGAAAGGGPSSFPARCSGCTTSSSRPATPCGPTTSAVPSTGSACLGGRPGGAASRARPQGTASPHAGSMAVCFAGLGPGESTWVAGRSWHLAAPHSRRRSLPVRGPPPVGSRGVGGAAGRRCPASELAEVAAGVGTPLDDLLTTFLRSLPVAAHPRGPRHLVPRWPERAGRWRRVKGGAEGKGQGPQPVTETLVCGVLW